MRKIVQKKTIKNMVSTLKNGDYEDVGNYFVDSKEAINLFKIPQNVASLIDISEESKKEIREIIKRMTKNLSYKINGLEKDENNESTFVVNMDITTSDHSDMYKKLLQETFMLSIKSAIGTGNVSEEALNNAINKIKASLSEDKKIITTNVNVRIEKVDDKYKIVNSSELVNALTGNIAKVAVDLTDNVNGLIGNIGNLIKNK